MRRVLAVVAAAVVSFLVYHHYTANDPPNYSYCNQHTVDAQDGNCVP